MLPNFLTQAKVKREPHREISLMAKNVVFGLKDQRNEETIANKAKALCLRSRIKETECSALMIVSKKTKIGRNSFKIV